jgi:predicted transcriptional regulator
MDRKTMRNANRKLLLEDAVAAWDHYKATGLHVTAEEADIWLSMLSAGEPAEIPQCHL